MRFCFAVIGAVVSFATVGCVPAPWKSCYYNACGEEVIRVYLDEFINGTRVSSPRFIHPVCTVQDVSFSVGTRATGYAGGLHAPYSLLVRVETDADSRSKVVIDRLSVRKEGDSSAFFTTGPLQISFVEDTQKKAKANKPTVIKVPLPDVLTPEDGKFFTVELGVTVVDQADGRPVQVRCTCPFVFMPKVDRGLFQCLGD